MTLIIAYYHKFVVRMSCILSNNFQTNKKQQISLKSIFLDRKKCNVRAKMKLQQMLSDSNEKAYERSSLINTIQKCMPTLISVQSVKHVNVVQPIFSPK